MVSLYINILNIILKVNSMCTWLIRSRFVLYDNRNMDRFILLHLKSTFYPILPVA